MRDRASIATANAEETMHLHLVKMRPRFHLATLLIIFPVVALLLWANLRQRVVVSHQFDLALGQPCVDVFVFYGWPFRYRSCCFLVLQGSLDDFLQGLPESSDWPDMFGVDPPAVDVLRLAVNVAAALCIVFGAAIGAEYALARAIRRKSQSPRPEKHTLFEE